ncbi:MAG: type VI secretion system tip protein VgrG [Bacteroidetes bacterium]|jgi:Rhs element Vgr protein|nr:MAG: type VI secretion system tip protein VgrG [Bacteroidota bacterium]
MANDQSIPQNVKGASVTFTVKIAGQAIPATIEVYSMNVIKEANRVPSARLTLLDGDPAKQKFQVSDEALFIPGKQIELFAGHQSKEDLIFKGIIIKHAISVRKNGSSQLKLECRDVAFQMTLGKKSSQFKDVKDSDIANNLFSKYKISIDKIEDTKGTHPEMIQHNCSDWDFVLTRMDVNGKLVLINDGKVEVKAPDFSPAPVLTLQYGSTIHEFDAEMDARNQYADVKAVSWDPASQEVVEVNGQTPSSFKENGNISGSQLADATGLKEYVLRHGGNTAREELQAWANACKQKSAMAKIRGRVSCDGFAKIKPGDVVELQGLSNRFNGKIFAAGIRHDLTNGGWETTVQFGMDPSWFAQKFNDQMSTVAVVPSISGLYTAVVAQLEKDPKGEDRILVKIPMIDMAAEGVWARMAVPDAGDQRGYFFRPEIGDEMLAGFINNDPRDVVLVGMLNSSKKPAPLQAKDANKEKGFFFKSKMKILFNDDDKSMLFETPGGNKITLSEKDKGIKIEDQNGNKLTLNSDGISLETKKKLTLKSSGGDVETEGTNIKQTAKSQYKAEGSAGIELTSSAIAKLKGSLVQIN